MNGLELKRSCLEFISSFSRSSFHGNVVTKLTKSVQVTNNNTHNHAIKYSRE